MLKRTPLHEIHVQLGARLIEFGGWEMPVQYAGIVEEHLAVRKAAGIFDISHMGEFQVIGPGAAGFLNAVLTNDIQKLQPGQGQYTLMCNEAGGVVDDLYVFRTEKLGTEPDHFLLIVNASRIEADFDWLRQHHDRLRETFQTDLLNVSDQLGAVAVQGPCVAGFMDRNIVLTDNATLPLARPSGLRKNQIARCRIGEVIAWISRTGYTGEDGFEIVVPAKATPVVWDAVMEAGRKSGLKPAGLGARDTLRLEACYPLYGRELDEQTTPIEAGLGRFISLEKPGFVGREALARQAAEGFPRKLAAFRMLDQSPPPRPGYAMFASTDGTECIGTVTSGTMCPSLGIGAGLAYVRPGLARPGTPVVIEIRGRRFAAETTAKPLYSKGSGP